MSRLISILSGVIISVPCTISKPQVQGYMFAGQTGIYICNNVTGSWSRDEIIVHELGHIFWYTKLKRTYDNEAWAYLFQSCWFDKKCQPVLRRLILKYI